MSDSCQKSDNNIQGLVCKENCNNARMQEHIGRKIAEPLKAKEDYATHCKQNERDCFKTHPLSC